MFAGGFFATIYDFLTYFIFGHESQYFWSDFQTTSFLDFPISDGICLILAIVIGCSLIFLAFKLFISIIKFFIGG